MIFPAWFDFHRDPTMRRHVQAHVLYAELIIRPGCFVQPIAVKAWAFAELLGIDRTDLARALDLLIRAGYLDEHPRENARAPRRVTVALVRRECVLRQSPTSSAA